MSLIHSLGSNCQAKASSNRLHFSSKWLITQSSIHLLFKMESVYNIHPLATHYVNLFIVGNFPAYYVSCLLSKVGVHRSAFLRRRSEPCSSSLCQHPTLGVRFSCPVPIGKTYPFFSSGQRRPWSPGNEVLAHVPPPASFLPCSQCFLAQLRVPSCLWPDLVRNGEMPSGEGCCTWRWTSSLQGGRCRGTI